MINSAMHAQAETQRGTQRSKRGGEGGHTNSPTLTVVFVELPVRLLDILVTAAGVDSGLFIVCVATQMCVETGMRPANWFKK